MNVNPQIMLSYRPIRSLEVFGSVDYHQTETTVSARSFTTDFPVFDPQTGLYTYEERIVNLDAEPPYKTTHYLLRFGLTYSGKLW